MGSLQREIDGEEVLDHLFSILGADAFGVELDPLDGMNLVSYAHDESVGSGGGDDERIGEVGCFGDQGMVAHGGEGGGQVVENPGAIVSDEAFFPMHDVGGVGDFSAKMVNDALVSQADAKERGCEAELLDHFIANAKVGSVCRVARSGGNNDVCRIYFCDVLHGEFVVFFDEGIASESFYIGGQDVGEGVVVIEDEGFHYSPLHLQPPPVSTFGLSILNPSAS